MYLIFKRSPSHRHWPDFQTKSAAFFKAYHNNGPSKNFIVFVEGVQHGSGGHRSIGDVDVAGFRFRIFTKINLFLVCKNTNKEPLRQGIMFNLTTKVCFENKTPAYQKQNASLKTVFAKCLVTSELGAGTGRGWFAPNRSLDTTVVRNDW
jgi:hypothetical protein